MDELKEFALLKLAEEISYFQEAENLLNKVWLEMGSYNSRPISNETIQLLNKHFKFDDSD
jgi:hypothetical protein